MSSHQFQIRARRNRHWTGEESFEWTELDGMTAEFHLPSSRNKCNS